MHQPQCLLLRQLIVPDVVIKGNALDKLHGVEEDSCVHAAVIDAGDVRMLQTSGQLHLQDETVSACHSEMAVTKDFECHVSLCAQLPRKIDRPHSANAKQAKNDVPR